MRPLRSPSSQHSSSAALKWRGAAFLVVSLLVCLSHIYVGTHYFTDILGGAATGMIAAVIVRSAYWEGTRVDRLITSIL